MKESVTYQAIVEEGLVKGRVEGEFTGMLRARQDDLLRLGGRRFGAASVETEKVLRNISDPQRLARLVDALLDVSNWQELLATP